MRNTSGLWRGGSPGRPAGARDRATREIRSFLDGVFSKALSDPQFEERLVRSIVELTIDTRLLALLLAYYVGRPPQSFDVTHAGTVSLAELICGRVPKDDINDHEADSAAGEDVPDSGEPRPSSSESFDAAWSSPVP